MYAPVRATVHARGAQASGTRGGLERVQVGDILRLPRGALVANQFGSPEVEDWPRSEVPTDDEGPNVPAVSPDGRWLAYESNESGRVEVFVRPFPDVEAGKWQVSGGGGVEPRWAPDAQTLYFLSSTSLKATAVSTSPAFTWSTPAPVLDRASYVFLNSARRYDVASDGSRFLMIKNAESQADGAEAARPRINVVLNWFEELRRLVPVN